MSASVPRCGRLDAHPEHEWTRPSTTLPAAIYECPGVVVIEGGYWPDRTHQEHIDEQNADYWTGAPE